MKLSCCTNGSIRVLNTWAASGAAGSGLSVTVVAVLRRRARRRPSAAARHCASTSSSSSTPTPVLVETQTIGVSVPCRDRLDAQPLDSSSVDGISPSKYFSITASSTSMIDSISDSLIDFGIDQRAGGVRRHVERADDALEVVAHGRSAR